jgi:hypothetical protein
MQSIRFDELQLAFLGLFGTISAKRENWDLK